MKNDTREAPTTALRSRQLSPPPQPAVRRPGRRHAIGISLRYKIFFGVLVLVLLIVPSVLALIQWKATVVTRAAIDAALKDTAGTFDTFIEDRFIRLRTAARQLADDPNVIAAFTSTDQATLLDLLASKRQEVLKGGAEYLMGLDAEGILLARTDDPAASGVSLGDKSPLFSIPITEGLDAWGFAGGKDRVRLAVASPVREGGTLLKGVLAMSYAVDQGLAIEARSVTNADASFFSHSRDGLALVATTLSSQAAATLAGALAEPTGIMQQSMGEGKVVGPVEVMLGADPNIVIAVPLVSASGERIGLFVASRSLYQEMAPYRQIRDTMLYLGIAAIVMAFVISYLMARLITRPIVALVEATEQVSEGNLDVEIPPAPNDEVGLLTKSFAKMLVELRQKAEMEEYLQSLKLQGGLHLGSTAPVAQSSLTASRVASSETAPTIGMLFNNRYEIAQILGSGGMGTVYRARDKELDEEIAIKTIKVEALKSDPTAIDRFRQEIKLARRITSKNVLRTYDFGEVNGVFYITMEYMRAAPLKYLLEQRRSLPLGPALHIAKQICLGLAAAHEQNIIHRDVKPQNLLVNAKGDLKIMDFGIARLQGSSGMTQTGMVVGTPDYMSPEQATGKPLDHRSDIYSTGVVLYEMFCGRLPFVADTALAIVMKHVQEAPLPPRQANPSLPPDLEKVILRCMAKDPAVRYQNITDLHEALSAFSVKQQQRG